MQHKTVVQVRKDLECWGLFWARQEMGSGFASKSVTARICETLETHVFSASDAYLFSHLSDNIFEPDHIASITVAVSKLSKPFKLAIRAKYINKTKEKGKPLDNYYTREAENAVMGYLTG